MGKNHKHFQPRKELLDNALKAIGRFVETKERLDVKNKFMWPYDTRSRMDLEKLVRNIGDSTIVTFTKAINEITTDLEKQFQSQALMLTNEPAGRAMQALEIFMEHRKVNPDYPFPFGCSSHEEFVQYVLVRQESPQTMVLIAQAISLATASMLEGTNKTILRGKRS